MLDVAMQLEQVALEDDYFVERKLYPNVDFYSGIIYRAMGFPTDLFTVLFAWLLLGELPRTRCCLAARRRPVPPPWQSRGVCLSCCYKKIYRPSPEHRRRPCYAISKVSTRSYPRLVRSLLCKHTVASR